MHFVITFGFLIPMKSDENVENDKDTGKDKVKKLKKRRKKKTINEDTYEIVESKQNIINVDQILAEIHGEYELLPGYNFQFDCRCWKTAAKIYTGNGDWSLRPILCPITKNAFWVIFSIHHIVYTNEIRTQKLFNYVITYRMFSGRKKFSERAKKDKVKGFYIDEKSINIEQHDFLEIYPFDSHKSDSTIKPEPKPIIVTHETDGDFSITTYVDAIPDSAHQCKFWKMIRKDRFPSESFKLEFFTISTEVEQKSKLKNYKNSVQKQRTTDSRRKQKNETTHMMNLRAETLFSDMGAITCFARTSQIPSVSSILIYAYCEDILSNKQLRMNLNPISIKLEQVSNFPDDVAIENDFSYIYAKMFFVDRVIVTPYYIPARAIYFEFVKCFLREAFQAEDLISSLGTKFLTVEIIGVRFTDVSKFPISTFVKMKPPSALEISWKEEVVLGVAEFDVSDLLRGSWEVKLTCSLSYPRNTYRISTDDKNVEGVGVSWKNSPLTSDILTSLGTSVKIKVRVAYDLRPVHRTVLQHVITLNRIFLILNNSKLANNILADVSSHNCYFFCTLQPVNEDADLKVGDTFKNILTGFAIDCCDKYFIFLEGLSKGYLLQIWDKVAKLSIEDGYVFYNSSYVFLTRFYEDFVPLGGVLKIKLSESLETQLRKHDLYIGETGTMLRAKIMRTIGLMKLAITMQSLSQKRLLPNSSDIKAFMDEIRENYFECSCIT